MFAPNVAVTPKPWLGAPFPLLVVYTIAPLAAREPYSAAAFGPFSTVTDAMLSALISDAALPTS